MSRRRQRARLAAVLGLFAWTVACSGGGGSPPGSLSGWEEDTGQRSARETPAPSGVDAPTRSIERPPASQESGSGGTGASGGNGSGPAAFVCSGAYVCSFTAQGQTARIPLSLVERDGVCTAGEAIISPDGTFTTDDGTTGTWVSTGDALTITVQGMSVTCTRTSSG